MHIECLQLSDCEAGEGGGITKHHESTLCLWWCRAALAAAAVDGLLVDGPAVLTGGFEKSSCTVCCHFRALPFRDIIWFSAGPQVRPRSDPFSNSMASE